MWRDEVHERYWWATIQGQLDELIYELSKAEEEEAAVLYLLGLHFDNAVDLKFFNHEEQERIKELLSILMNYSIKHREILEKAIKELTEKRKKNARQTI